MNLRYSPTDGSRTESAKLGDLQFRVITGLWSAVPICFRVGSRLMGDGS